MHPNLSKVYGCVLAPTIVDVTDSTTVPAHLFNPNSYPVVVRQDYMVS